MRKLIPSLLFATTLKEEKKQFTDPYFKMFPISIIMDFLDPNFVEGTWWNNILLVSFKTNHVAGKIVGKIPIKLLMKLAKKIL